MTYTHTHLAIRLNGGFGAVVTAPIDKWSVGFRVGIPGSDIMLATPALITFLNAVHTAASTMHNAAGMLAGTNCSFSHVTGARVGVDGKYDPQSQLTQTSTGAPIFGAGVPVGPWSQAASFGLRTAVPRGYASNGRTYYPAVAAQPSSATGRLTSSQVTGRVNLFRTFINAVNTAANTYEAGAGVCVMSAVGAGTTQRVIAVRSDERLDAVERRENDTAVVYTTVAL